MKKLITVILIVSGVGLLSWAQGTKDPFDAKKSAQELEIMRGILSTTISYVEENSQGQNIVWRNANLRALYLANQGAVFLIPISSGNAGYFSEPIVELGDYGQDNELFIRQSDVSVVAGRSQQNRGNPAPAAAPAAPAPSAAPTPPAPPAPPAPSQVDREELRKKVDEFREKAKQRRAEAEANRAKLRQRVDEVKIHLMEALANYGDSLTTVKPNEFINVVLETNDNSSDAILGQRRPDKRHDILSVQKSWITDYKAGKLNLESFKQKVLQYTE